jgi:hypothetical protein
MGRERRLVLAADRDRNFCGKTAESFALSVEDAPLLFDVFCLEVVGFHRI